MNIYFHENTDLNDWRVVVRTLEQSETVQKNRYKKIMTYLEENKEKFNVCRVNEWFDICLN